MHDLIARLDGFIATAAEGAPGGLPRDPGAGRAEDFDEALAAFRRLARIGAGFEALGNSAAALHRCVVTAAVETLGGTRGGLFIKNVEGGLDLVTSLFESAEDEVRLRRPIERALARGEVVWEGDGGLGLVCVPLLRARAEVPGEDRRRIVRPRDDDVLGLLLIEATGAPRPAEALALEALARHAVTALVRDGELRAAITDAGTGTFTRPQLNSALARLVGRFESARAPFCLLLANVDRFRDLNESLGHAGADRILRALARGFRAALRDADLLFRYGGDTFAFLLPDTDSAGGEVVAEKLRATVAERDHGVLALTVSLGLAACPQHAAAAAALLVKADQALAHAKAAGRNTCVTWDPESGPGARRQDPLAGILTGDFADDYRQVQTLLETLAELGRCEDLDGLMTQAVDAVIAATDSERGALMLADARGILTTTVARGRDGHEMLERFSRSIPERVLRTLEPCCEILSSSPAPRSESFTALDLKSVLCAPLSIGRLAIGVLYTDCKAVAGEPRENMLPFFSALTSTIALAIENARLRRLAAEPHPRD